MPDIHSLRKDTKTEANSQKTTKQHPDGLPQHETGYDPQAVRGCKGGRPARRKQDACIGKGKDRQYKKGYWLMKPMLEADGWVPTLRKGIAKASRTPLRVAWMPDCNIQYHIMTPGTR